MTSDFFPTKKKEKKSDAERQSTIKQCQCADALLHKIVANC